MFFFYILKVYYIAKADNSNSCFLAKSDNSTFPVLELKKNTCLNFVISSDDNVDAWQTLLVLWS